jgi:hypothetical protein
MGPDVDTGSATTRSIDVQRTLQYESHVYTRKLIWMPIVCLAVGLWVLLYGSVHDKMQWQPWLGLFLGAGWLIYAFYRLAVPAPPMLVLSPEGLIWRNVSNRLIRWQDVRDVTQSDHDVWVRGRRQTIENVTIVWVSRRFYNQKIFVRSLLMRGPFWGNAFVHRDDATGIVVASGVVSAEPDPLHEEIVARWQAFRLKTSVPAAQRGGRVELADDVEGRKPQAKLMWLAIVLAPTIMSVVVYLIVSAFYPSEEKRWARSEAERMENDRRTKEIFEQVRRDGDNMILSMREKSPWMFSDDNRFNEPGTIPPQKLGVAPAGHRGSVASLALIGDGRNFLSASGDGTIKFWDMEKTIPLRDAGLHGGAAREVRLLPGGATFISGGDDSQIVVRSLIDGKVLYRINAREYGHVRSLEVAADGKRALCLHEKGVVVWDLETKTATRVLKDTGATVVDMSNDGKLAVLGSHDGKLLAWEIDAGNEPRQIGSHQHGVFAVAIMPDGKRVVSGGGGDYVLRMRDLATGDVIRSFAAHKAVTYTIEVSADGKRMVSGSHDRTARLWDAETGEEITRLDQSNTVRAVAFLADGTILTAGDDRSIRLWSRHGFREREFAGVAKE